MLKLTATSGNTKTGSIAVTMRSGASMFATCPGGEHHCPFMPARERENGAKRVDRAYLDALIRAVPRAGLSWTYTHFPVRTWIQRWRAAKGPRTTINASANTERQAADWLKREIPVVVAIPADVAPRKAWRAHGVRFVRCPAEYSDLTCQRCGGGTPLCARADRDYVIVFHAHGASRKRVGTGDGGCYAAGGNTALHWRKTIGETDSDASRLTDWIKSLPPRTMVRHHVAGDIGA